MEIRKPLKFNIIHYCPALIALLDKHITDERGYLLPSEHVVDFGLTVEVELSPGESSAFTDCEAPIIKGKAKHPGAPWVEFIESTESKDRYKVKCKGCVLKRGGFKSTATVFKQS